jgi:hypothetical protein
MATAFNRYRGESQGRIVPRNVAAVDADRVFVLGADGPTEPQILSDGDYTQVAQDVDLTTIDLVGASMETVGVAMQDFTYPVGLQVEADTIALWRMDYDFAAAGLTPGALNWVKPGPDLDGEGDIAAVLETYGPAGYRGLSRQVPLSSTTARLRGANTPAIIPAGLSAYTLDLWLDFDADARAAANGGVATGIDPVLFDVTTAGGGGLRVYLAGTVGVKEWTVAVTHQDAAGVAVTRTFAAWPITTTLGWTMLSVAYDAAEVGADKLKLYADGLYVASGSSAITQDPAPAAAGEVLDVADPDLWGRIDQVRLSNTAHGATAVLADYDQCTDPPTTHAAQWIMQVLIDGVIYAERVIAAGEARTWADYYAPVRHLNGTHAVAFRLKLHEVT